MRSYKQFFTETHRVLNKNLQIQSILFMLHQSQSNVTMLPNVIRYIILQHCCNGVRVFFLTERLSAHFLWRAWAWASPPLDVCTEMSSRLEMSPCSAGLKVERRKMVLSSLCCTCVINMGQIWCKLSATYRVSFALHGGYINPLDSHCQL